MRRVLTTAAAVPLIAAPLVNVGCTQPMHGSSRGPDLAAERARLLETDRRLAATYSTSDAPIEAIFASFTDDARVLAPEVPMAVGWEASRALFAALEALPGYELEYHPTLAEVGGAGDLGYTIGTYRMTLPDADGRLVEIDGKYLSLWRRQADGTWKIAVDTFNSNGPPVPVGAARQESHAMETANPVAYLEVVTPDVDAVCATHAAAVGLEFGPPDPALGNARTARLPGGGMFGVRAPMHESESPIVRPYWLVDDIDAAIAAAEASGAEIALPPMPLPGHGICAIYVDGGVQHGFWQKP